MLQIVVKIGSSSITNDKGLLDDHLVAKLCGEVAELRSSSHRVVIVTSGAVAAGLPALGMAPDTRSHDAATLQAVSAVGQGRLIDSYQRALGRYDLLAGQVLLAPLDFFVRAQYLHARRTLARLLELGVVPVVNENDAIADDEIRFGDNDRIAALVAHLVEADLLILLTDTPGMLTGDPHGQEETSLIEEILEIDQEMENLAGGTGSALGSGGMASKLAAAKIASWSGVSTVIADAKRANVVRDAVAGRPGIGTFVRARQRKLSARRLWIAFAVGSSGQITVDQGARAALEDRRVSLLPTGVTDVEGIFESGSAVEVLDPDGAVFAKGITRYDSEILRSNMGLRTIDLPEGVPHEVIHADDLVVLPR